MKCYYEDMRWACAVFSLVQSEIIFFVQGGKNYPSYYILLISLILINHIKPFYVNKTFIDTDSISIFISGAISKDSLSMYNAHALKPHLHARFIVTQMYPFFSLCVSECALSITFCIFLMFWYFMRQMCPVFLHNFVLLIYTLILYVIY